MKFSTRNSKYYYDNIRLDEGAYFYKAVEDGRLTKKQISNIFIDVKKDKPELSREIKRTERMIDGSNVLCSLLLFKNTTPSILLKNPPHDLAIAEVHIGYLLIEVEQYR